MYYLLEVEVLMLFLLCCDGTYTFLPESRHVDVNNGDSYRVIFTEINSASKKFFTHCYIESDFIKKHYEIAKNTFSSDVKWFKTLPGSCGFLVNPTVAEEGPKLWKISVYNDLQKKNYTETVTVALFHNVPIFLHTVNIIPGASYFNYLQFAPNVSLIKCELKFDNISVDLDLHTKRTVVHGEIDGDFTLRLSSLDDGKCGFKVINSSPNDPKEVFLIAKDDQNIMYRNKAVINILNRDYELMNRTQEVHLGDRTTIMCGNEPDNRNNFAQVYCFLYNPQKKLVFKNRVCWYKLDVVTLNDLGLWSCTIGYTYSMKSLKFFTNITRKEKESVETWSENTFSSYRIGCKLIHFSNPKINFCRFTRPDGEVFTVLTGGATPRYTTLTTNLTSGFCGIEISKPLLPQEVGTWKCEASLGITTPGAFLNVQKASKIQIKHQHSEKNVHLEESFTIDCMVPFSSDSCYITAPNGTQFSTKDPSRTNLGECVKTIAKATISDNGTWTCAFSQEYGPEEIITIQVSIVDVKILFSNVEAQEGETIDLLCNTGGIPLNYCRFIAPSGLSYSLKKSESRSKEIAYKGRGLDFGDCGIRIFHASLADSGQWHCFISSGPYQHQLKNRISLIVLISKSGPTALESALIIIGAFALLLIAGLVFYKYRGFFRKRILGENVSVRYNRRSRSAINFKNLHNYNTNTLNYRRTSGKPRRQTAEV